MTITISGLELPNLTTVGNFTITVGHMIYLLVDYDPRRKVTLFAPWRSVS